MGISHIGLKLGIVRLSFNNNIQLMDLKEFSRLVEIVFDKPMIEYGFKLERKKLENDFCERIYINSDRYVKISANIHPMDAPAYYNIVLGQGGIDWPECDWNAVALWRIKKDLDPKLKAKEYSLQKMEGLEKSLNHAKGELLKYGDPFLNGDLKHFFEVRKIQTRSREPYKIYQPTEGGGREMIIDAESSKLKEKYS